MLIPREKHLGSREYPGSRKECSTTKVHKPSWVYTHESLTLQRKLFYLAMKAVTSLPAFKVIFLSSVTLHAPGRVGSLYWRRPLYKCLKHYRVCRYTLGCCLETIQVML